jgi:Uma2 family endonuclease
MSVLAAPTELSSGAPALPLYRFSRGQYQRLFAEGILTGGDPVEWVDGLIVWKGDSARVPTVRALPNSTTGNGQEGPALPVRPFSVAEYQRMVATDILGEEDPVELLQGWIVLKMPRNPPHDAVVARLQNKVIGPRLPADWSCRGQSAIDTDTSEPEPDLAIVRGTEFDYLDHHPTPREMTLAIEVADSSLHRDRTFKAALYGRAGIPVYWIVNLPGGVVEVYTDPTGPTEATGYRQRQDFGRGEEIPLLLDGREVARIPVQDLLP